MPTLFRDWFTDRPIEVPAQLLAAGFVDVSWHNDAAPSMHYRSSETAEVVLCAWIGDEFFKEECGTDMYILEVGECDESGAWVEGYDLTRKLLYTGDDLAELIRIALESAERLKSGAVLSSFSGVAR